MCLLDLASLALGKSALTDFLVFVICYLALFYCAKIPETVNLKCLF